MSALFLVLVGLLAHPVARADELARSSAVRAQPVHYAPDASAPAFGALRWRWDEPRRIFALSEVHLPGPVWFLGDRNVERRVVAWQIRAVLDCHHAIPMLKSVWEVTCRIEDVALAASGLHYGKGRLDAVLQEVDHRLSQASLQLQVHHDGRVLDVDLEGLDRPRRRVGVMNETLRQLMSRTVAGMDLQVTDGPVGPGSVWPQYHTWLAGAVARRGTSGSTELLHEVQEETPDGRIVVSSEGKGVMVPDGGHDKYASRFTSVAVFDPGVGFLTERVWQVIGAPTASSPASEGFLGLPYVQLGRMRLLAADEQVDLGPTEEVPPPNRTPTTLQR